MGQYYHPCILKEDWRNEKQPVDFSTYAHAYGSGLKLMETCYTGVRYIDYITHMLATTYKGRPFVFCGDYADTISTPALSDRYLSIVHYILNEKSKPEDLQQYVKTDGKLRDMVKKYRSHFKDFKQEMNHMEFAVPCTIADEIKALLNGCDDLEIKEQGTCDLYGLAWEWIEENKMEKFKKSTRLRYKYILNLDKKQYVAIPPNKKGEWCINPLTILCSFGNGRGGGDYRHHNPYVGTWAFDRIAVTKDKGETIGFNEIKPGFVLD